MREACIWNRRIPVQNAASHAILGHIRGARRNMPSRKLKPLKAVIGLGQAMVDYAGYVSDAFLDEVLEAIDGEKYSKGDRICVNVEQLGQVLNKLDSADFKVTTGGSLSNTLVALSRLGSSNAKIHNDGNQKIRVGMAGLVGNDPVGSFYKAKMERAGVNFLSEAICEDSTTGTVIVLTTPDAQRTMLSHWGTTTTDKESLLMTPQVKQGIESSKVLLIEGYMWECGEDAKAFMMEAVQLAKENGVLVGLTLSDASVVQAHKEDLWHVIHEYADIVFSNESEACALTGVDSAQKAASCLAEHTRVVSCVTDGHRGSHLAGMGLMQHVPAYWMPKGPLDTCGAGDAYAAGVLYALLGGANIRGMGYSGSRVSSTVISQRGARLKTEDAQRLAEVLPMHMYEEAKLVNYASKANQS